jgi:hypothetical protein
MSSFIGFRSACLPVTLSPWAVLDITHAYKMLLGAKLQ